MIPLPTLDPALYLPVRAVLLTLAVPLLMLPAVVHSWRKHARGLVVVWLFFAALLLVVAHQPLSPKTLGPELVMFSVFGVITQLVASWFSGRAAAGRPLSTLAILLIPTLGFLFVHWLLPSPWTGIAVAAVTALSITVAAVRGSPLSVLDRASLGAALLVATILGGFDAQAVLDEAARSLLAEHPPGGFPFPSWIGPATLVVWWTTAIASYLINRFWRNSAAVILINDRCEYATMALAGQLPVLVLFALLMALAGNSATWHTFDSEVFQMEANGASPRDQGVEALEGLQGHPVRSVIEELLVPKGAALEREGVVREGVAWGAVLAGFRPGDLATSGVTVSYDGRTYSIQRHGEDPPSWQARYLRCGENAVVAFWIARDARWVARSHTLSRSLEENLASMECLPSDSETDPR